MQELAQLESFFKKVWATSGYLCLATPLQQGGYKHKVCQTVQQACKEGLMLAKQGRDAYFALGTLKEPYIETDELNNYGKPKRKYRVGENISHMRCFFYDLDCGKDKPYATQVEALQALKTTVKKLGLPKPILVNSGGGVHVYFPLTEEIPVDEWKPLAFIMKRLMLENGLEVDPSRTTDTSSVLRIPFTANFKKDTPRPVVLLNDAEPTPNAVFIALVERLRDTYNITPPVIQESLVKLSPALAEKFGNNLTVDEPINMDLVYAKCPQMARCAEVGGPVGYGMRGAWTSILKLSKDPDFSIMELNDPDPDTVRKQTEYFLTGTHTDHPHTCEKIESCNPGGCDGCEFKGQVKSPAVLGRVKKPKIIPKSDTSLDEVLGEQKYTMFRTHDDMLLPLPPSPFLFKDGKIVYELYEEGDGYDIEVYEHVTYPITRLWDNAENCESVKICVGTGHDGFRYLTVPLTELTDARAMAKRLASVGVLFESNKKWDGFFNYMTSYIKHLQAHWAATKNYPRLGWQDDEDGVFVLPSKTIVKGKEEPSGLAEKVKHSVDGIKKKGTLAEWVNVVNTYNRVGFEPHAFGHLVGYGSLLFEYQKYEGAIVNLVSPHSGSGKSTVLQTVETMWGRSKDLRMIKSDTLNAKFNRIGVYNSICPTFDEITNIDEADLSEFCYSISQGRAKSRLNATMSESRNHAHWKCILLSSSNANLMSKLASNKGDSTAEMMRVFEYYVNETDILSKEEASLIFDKLDSNYGHAGEIFVNYVSENIDEVKELIKGITAKFDKAANVPNRERYWSSIVACSLAGGTIARRLGLCSFDIKSLFNWAVDQTVEMRRVVNENRQTEGNILVKYLNDTLGNTIRVSNDKLGAGEFVSLGDDSRISKLYNRIEVDSGIMYIARSAIREYIQKSGLDYNSVKTTLIHQKIVINDAKNIVLTKGSGVLTTGSSVCWVINMNHPEMAGQKLSVASINGVVLKGEVA